MLMKLSWKKGNKYLNKKIGDWSKTKEKRMKKKQNSSHKMCDFPLSFKLAKSLRKKEI